MIIAQEAAEYVPIVITLEKRSEAKAFFNLLHAVEAHRCHSSVGLYVGKKEAKILVQLINADTDEDINF